MGKINKKAYFPRFSKAKDFYRVEAVDPSIVRKERIDRSRPHQATARSS